MAIPATTYRPMPPNFPEMFEEHGWEGILDELRVHKNTLKRWMIDYGEEVLQQRRRAYLEAKYAAEGKRIPGRRPGAAKRYVLGRTLSAVNSAKVER